MTPTPTPTPPPADWGNCFPECQLNEIGCRDETLPHAPGCPNEPPPAEGCGKTTYVSSGHEVVDMDNLIGDGLIVCWREDCGNEVVEGSDYCPDCQPKAEGCGKDVAGGCCGEDGYDGSKFLCPECSGAGA